MIDTKKEQERDELHRAIWAIADELRGAVDGWDFKNYVLGTMFYRYISENLANYINEGEIKAGNDGFDYAKMSDSEAEAARKDMVQVKGFFILPSELFCNVLARCQSDENLNETLETVFRHIEESAKGTESEGQFAGLFSVVTEIINQKIKIEYYNNFKSWKSNLTEGNKTINSFEDIAFENVSFIYPNTEKTVLKNISFKIYKNQKVGIIGKNGSGKTTIIKLGKH